VWRTLADHFARVLAFDAAMAAAFNSPSFSDERRKALHNELKARVAAIPDRAGTAPDASAPDAGEKNLLEYLDEQTERLVASASVSHPEVAVAWADFAWYDAHFFPIDYFGDLGEKDPIEVVRVSPLDAERAFSNRNFEDKITGETVMHFGAFLKKSWRSNDIMWGRLDGVCRLLDSLLTPEALRRAVANPEVRALLRADLEGAAPGEPGELHPKTLFPSAGAAIQKDMYDWLCDLTSDDAAARARAVRDEPNTRHYELLLWCAQLEILHENLPTVLEDATTEQLEWNNLRAKRGFRTMGLRIDRATGRLIGKQVTNEFIDTLRKEPSEFTEIPNAPIAKYFLTEYAVGSESVREDIPPSVLIETITAASLVARNCLLNAFPEQGDKLRSNLLYKALVHWPMTAVHMLAVLARRERTLYVAALTALFMYAIVALVGGVVWLGVDVSTGDGTDRSRMIFLVVLPLIILVAGGYMAWLHVMRHTGRAWSAVLTRGALAVVSAAALFPAGLALVAAWGATNDTLRGWFAAAPKNSVAQ